MGTTSFDHKSIDTDKFRKIMDDALMKSYSEHASAVEAWVRSFMLQKYGVTTLDDTKEIIASKRLRLCYDTQHNFYGIIANNRWLYTIDGKIIGKKKGKFNSLIIIVD